MLEKSILHGLRSWICTGGARGMDQASGHKFLNLRHNSEHVDHVISGTDRPQENRIFRPLETHKKIAFYPNRKIFSLGLIP